MSEIIFYHNNCPKCKILEKKLKDKGVKYKESNNFEEIMEVGFKSVPVLKINEKYLNFSAAIKYINNL